MASMMEELREKIKKSKLTELEMYTTDESIKDMLDSIQELKSKMNTEIMNSIKEITLKYQQDIDDLEEQYAFILSLKVDNID